MEYQVKSLFTYFVPHKPRKTVLESLLQGSSSSNVTRCHRNTPEQKISSMATAWRQREGRPATSLQWV